jgi:hypothetical protein
METQEFTRINRPMNEKFRKCFQSLATDKLEQVQEKQNNAREIIVENCQVRDYAVTC